MNEKYICPVCGFDGLKDVPYSKEGDPSYEVCPCCGFEFGFDIDDSEKGFKMFRQKWIEGGAKWFIQDKKPNGWDLNSQLENIN